MTSQGRPQGDAISVADARGNLIDALIAGPQQFLGQQPGERVVAS